MNRLEPTEGEDLLSMLPGKLEDMAIALGLKGYRGSQLFSWIHKRRVMDPEEMTNLPRALRDHLSTLGPILPMKRGRVLLSSDGTRKIEVILMDGSRVETVLIPEGNKLTQCISTQVGCAVGCVFCRSGKDGLKRNLTAAEIVGQIFVGKGEHIPNERLSNVVLMAATSFSIRVSDTFPAFRFGLMPALNNDSLA